MKNITNFINEQINPVNKPLVKDFICWYFDLDDISEFTFEDFERTDFDPESLYDYFKGDKKKQYDYIMEYIDEPIGPIRKKRADKGDFYHMFNIGDIMFEVLAYGRFQK